MTCIKYGTPSLDRTLVYHRSPQHYVWFFRYWLMPFMFGLIAWQFRIWRRGQWLRLILHCTCYNCNLLRRQIYVTYIALLAICNLRDIETTVCRPWKETWGMSWSTWYFQLFSLYDSIIMMLRGILLVCIWNFYPAKKKLVVFEWKIWLINNYSTNACWIWDGR